ncbi:hypothetical protein [Brevibacillus migulae]|uniref:hypothetical protein n=1 Tax=Brevibacillus migulae TaxID=1644114 RepID=UPI00106DEDDF|nr:hypothetical protein [Brevibacillus migulae]
MNRWHVFAIMKDHFLRTGNRLSIPQVAVQFDGKMPMEEIAEGIEEFMAVYVHETAKSGDV